MPRAYTLASVIPAVLPRTRAAAAGNPGGIEPVIRKVLVA
jgi:hypothetical protein